MIALCLKHWRIAFLAAVTVLVVITAVKVAVKAQKPGRTGEQTRTAFLRWRPQIQALHRGEDVYRAYAYPNPPIMALVLSPFAALPPMIGNFAWFGVKLAMAVMMLVMIRRLIDPDRILPDGIFAIATLLGLHPILGDLTHGNVNLFVAFLVVAGLDAFRRGRDVPAGLFIAFAISCKLTPALFVPFFIWKGSWRVLVGMALGIILAWGIVPGLLLGFDFNFTLLQSWFETMVKPFVIDGFVTSEHPNQSLPGVLTRLLTDAPSFIDYENGDGKLIAVESSTLIYLTPTAVSLIVKGTMLAFAVMMAWRMGGKSSPRSGLHFAAEAGAVILGMLLFSERTWKHHAVALALPFAALAAAAWLRPARRLRYGIVLVVCPIMALAPSMVNERTHDLFMVYGVFTLQYTLLLMVMIDVMALQNQDHKDRHHGKNPMEAAVPTGHTFLVPVGNRHHERITR